MSRHPEYEIKLYREDEGDADEREYVVTYSISPGRPATRIDPEEYPEVELVKVTCDGLPFMDDHLDDWFVEQITDQHEWTDERAERAEHKYDQMREAHMERDLDHND